MTSSPVCESKVTLPAMLDVVICAMTVNESVNSTDTRKSNLFCINF